MAAEYLHPSQSDIIIWKDWMLHFPVLVKLRFHFDYIGPSVINLPMLVPTTLQKQVVMLEKYLITTIT